MLESSSTYIFYQYKFSEANPFLFETGGDYRRSYRHMGVMVSTNKDLRLKKIKSFGVLKASKPGDRFRRPDMCSGKTKEAQA